jgi:hypothetical protein
MMDEREMLESHPIGDVLHQVMEVIASR